MTIALALKTDSTSPSHQLPAAPAPIPCSAPAFPCSGSPISLFDETNSLFRKNRELPHNTLIPQRYSRQNRPRSTRKKENFPVIPLEQGISAAAPSASTPSETALPPAIQPPAPAPAGPAPLRYRPIHADQALKLYAHGLDDADVADFFGILTTTLDRWRRERPDFAVAVSAAAWARASRPARDSRHSDRRTGRSGRAPHAGSRSGYSRTSRRRAADAPRSSPGSPRRPG
ncbi:MAG: hypothetical protein JWN66_1548 [Sphingomonas bacterium]|nr:hypothetical protein [Sphingomonas bacterium]